MALPAGSGVVLVTSRRRFHLPVLAPCDLDALPPPDAAALLPPAAGALPGRRGAGAAGRPDGGALPEALASGGALAGAASGLV
jgi:hypothetical protein